MLWSYDKRDQTGGTRAGGPDSDDGPERVPDPVASLASESRVYASAGMLDLNLISRPGTAVVIGNSPDVSHSSCGPIVL